MQEVILELSFYTSTILVWLLDSWKSEDRVVNMNPLVPMEILSAGQDELIAPHHQQRIRDAAAAHDITFLSKDDADHNNLWGVVQSDTTKHLRFMDLCLDRVDVE
jgi:hypothetical protein